MIKTLQLVKVSLTLFIIIIFLYHNWSQFSPICERLQQNPPSTHKHCWFTLNDLPKHILSDITKGWTSVPELVDGCNLLHHLCKVVLYQSTQKVVSNSEASLDKSSLTKNGKVIFLCFQKIHVYMNSCSMHARTCGGVTLQWHITGAADVVYFLLLWSPKQPQIKEIQS